MSDPPSTSTTMASPTESSPLLLGGHPTQPLEVRAAELIAQGASSSGIILPPPPLDLTHEFASSLYALHIVERHDRARGSARAAAFRASESARTRAALRDHALASLDAALEYVGLPDDDKDDEDDDDVLVMSRPLPVKRRCTTVAALLAHHTTPGAVLAHPLIRAALPRAWSRSRRSRRQHGRGLRALLDNAITPARAHLLELTASSVFVALTLVTALVPDIDVGVDTSGPTSIVWMVWSWAAITHALIDAVSRRRGPSSTAHLFLMLPAQASGVLMSIFGKVGPMVRFATLLRAVAIPCCTLAAVLPSAPSLPFLFPARLLPLATILNGILSRGAKAAALLIPVTILIWQLLAYALNGEVGRASPRMVALGGAPVEVGVAPFETRVALFITLVLVMILSAGLSILRAMAPSDELHDGTWEAEYGSSIGHNSRRALAAAVARYLPPSPDAAPPAIPLPLPLNFIVVPYDMLAAIWTAFRREPPYVVRRIRGWLGLVIVAIPCGVMAPLAIFLPRW